MTGPMKIFASMAVVEHPLLQVRKVRVMAVVVA
jgi:hypothetical protein